jgi:hypothetical protein
MLLANMTKAFALEMDMVLMEISWRLENTAKWQPIKGMPHQFSYSAGRSSLKSVLWFDHKLVKRLKSSV